MRDRPAIPMKRRLAWRLSALVVLLPLAGLQAQPAHYESEPNDTPAQANAIGGAVTVFGTMDKGDQDGFVWTVSDDDARKRWTFELRGIPGRLTIAEVVRVEMADGKSAVVGAERLMKMGTRDGLTPSIARDLIFEPGEYLIGIAYGGGSGEGSGGAFRPPMSGLSFGDKVRPEKAPGAAGAAEGASGANAAASDAGGYRFAIREGSRLDVSRYPGPRNTRKTAQALRPGTEFATFESQPSAWYALGFGQKDAGRRWDIAAQVPVGRRLDATLYDPAGKKLAAAKSDERGRLVFPDIAPAAGTYHLELTAKAAEFVHAVASQAVGQRVDGEEAEPNGEWKLANRVDLSKPLTGRVNANNESDYFVFALDESRADRLLGLRVDSEPGGQAMEVCLRSADGQPVQCRRGNTPVELPDLQLSAGDWGLSVSRARAGPTYRVVLQEQGPIAAGAEAEPNDAIGLASSVPANNRVKGRFSGDEEDFFRFDITGEPQLWRFQVIGDEIHEVAYHDGASRPGASVRVERGRKRVRLDNVFLMPGQHFLRVSGRDGGRYTVLARAIGPPDPNGEREPNDDESRMQRLAVGQTRTGLLAEPADVDRYRFFLGNWDHVRLTVAPAADGAIDAQLLWHGAAFAAGASGSPGKPMSLSGLLPPGDYQLVLRAKKESEAEYRLSLERLPRFSCPDGCAPGRYSGFAFGEAEAPAAPPAAGPVGSTLVLEHDRISAFRTHGQRVAGSLRVSNAGDRPVALELEAATSDHRWRARLDRSRVELPANGSAQVPVEILAPADAWADWPTRISVSARSSGGARTEAWADVVADRDIAPVAPRFGWQIPDALRGGFNAAWSGLGSRWSGAQPPADKLELLRDGQVFAGSRVEFRGTPGGWKDGNRPVLTLRLPGDAPVPVAGVAWNHFGWTNWPSNVRRATLLLSSDGVDFAEVLRFETLPVPTEQYFALKAPVPARHVRLRLEETFGLPSGQGPTQAGEWKVIAQPGFDLSGGAGFNLADPALGGHVVSDRPPQAYSPDYVLDEAKKPHMIPLKEGEHLEYVLGFHHGRAAQIRRIEWVYAGDVVAVQKLDRLRVAVSADSPVGPWRPVGEVSLASAGPVAALALDAPVWARFVRLIGVPGKRAGVFASPNAIRIWERATGDDYRSILTEWGQASRQAFHEAQAGLKTEPELKPAGNDSRDRAAPLAPGQRAGGQVALGKREHWYRVQVPAGHNTLTFALTGEPTVRARIALQDAAGAAIPVRRLAGESSSARHVYQAVVEPGSAVFVRLFEPPRNVVFAWDTSASVNAYLPTIYNALAAFSSQVVAGREAVNLMPFGRGTLLKDWHGQAYVLQTILNDYPRSESSSAAELTLKRSARALAPLPGSKSIVVITDGETVHDGSMWKEMQEVRPQVFGVHVAGSAAWHQDVFEDWASVNGGHYTQLVHQGEMEVAFDRAATLMRRPADYALEVRSEFRKAPGPGKLRVVAAGRKAASSGAAVALILDASGSMLKRMQGKRRIDVAREVLTEAVRQHVPAGTPLALRVFGHKEVDSCRTDLEMPLAPLDPGKAARVIGGIRAMNLARTPIADSLAAVERDLKGAKGSAAIVLVTDGEETCGGDPAKVIEALKKKGLDVRVNIVGFAIGDAGLEERFASWAELGGGRYFRAQDREGLSDALREALRSPFDVYDRAGHRVAGGTVGGEAVALEPGTYRIEVRANPKRSFEQMEISGGKEHTVAVE